jgi:hypothetical protein
MGRLRERLFDIEFGIGAFIERLVRRPGARHEKDQTKGVKQFHKDFN